MTQPQREKFLKILVGVVVGLYLLDWMVLTPAVHAWGAQSERIAELRQKVQHGRELLERQDSIRDRWAEMRRTGLPQDKSAAEDSAIKGVNRWVQASRVALTNLSPQWREHDEGYDTYECRATANGDQASLGRFIYELETDPLPARLEECEFSTRDKSGHQLSLALRFSFVRFNGAGADTP